MCGISAIVSLSIDGIELAIERMVCAMAHRGPDGDGNYFVRVGEVFLALGHNRLSIIDLSDRAAQPMKSRDGRYILVYNGEVYNYRDIARELRADELPGGRIAAVTSFITHQFVHGDLAHLGINSAWLLAFGTPVARLATGALT